MNHDEASAIATTTVAVTAVVSAAAPVAPTYDCDGTKSADGYSMEVPTEATAVSADPPLPLVNAQFLNVSL